jgi:hypothetical protein
MKDFVVTPTPSGGVGNTGTGSKKSKVYKLFDVGWCVVVDVCVIHLKHASF